MAVSEPAAGDPAHEGTGRVLNDHQNMVLSGADREAFIKALTTPPAASARLIAALRHHDWRG